MSYLSSLISCFIPALVEGQTGRRVFFQCCRANLGGVTVADTFWFAARKLQVRCTLDSFTH